MAAAEEEQPAASSTPPPATVVDKDLIPTKKGPGVLLRTLRKGDGGHFPKPGDSCLVHFEGRLEDGTLFASTRERKQIFQFTLGKKHIIEGLEVAAAKMSVGQLAEVTIPSLYAYGSVGCPPKIPPRATLIFTLELLQVEPKDSNSGQKKD
jgi:FKBP-type peptidyl-prolyl cis-trans isomerase